MRSPRRLPFITLAALGFFSASVAGAANLDAACEESIERLPALESLSQLYTGILSRPSLHCTHATLNSCAGEQLDTYWHYRAVDADLMEKEMKAWRASGKSGGLVPIAIVDGLFGPDIGQLLQKPPTVESRTKFGADKSGHGSQTSQFIGGAPGQGIAPDNPLTVYDVAYDAGSVQPEDQDKATLDACEKGQRVISVSLNVNKARADFSKQISELVTKLANKGCVLVKAAGNDSVRDSKLINAYVSDFGSYLNVGATRPSGGVAGFSDEGSVYAPGQGLAVTLPPSQILTCGTPRVEAVVGGTSFAAPIVAAITSQVVEVLQSSPKFRALSPLNQTRTIVEVVRGSADAPTGNVSALKAVRAAMGWVEKAAGHAAPATPANCGSIPAACTRASGPADCAAEQGCSEAFRTALALCPERLPKDSLPHFLGASAVDPWLGFRVADAFRRSGAKDSLLATQKLLEKTYDEAYWKREFSRVKQPPIQGLDTFLDIYSRVRLGKKPVALDFQITDMMMRLRWDPRSDPSHTARGFVEEIFNRPEAHELMRETVRKMVVEKRSLKSVAAIDALDRLNQSQGGTPEMDGIAISFAESFPAYERPQLSEYLRVLANGDKPLGNTQEVVEALMGQAVSLDHENAARVKAELHALKEKGLVSEADEKRWVEQLDY